ncbi:MAG: hypothetical protein ACI4N3_00675 [Alphaproteobacteria bacterium]
MLKLFAEKFGMGGGKNPVKSNSYKNFAICLCLIFFISLTIFALSGSVNAARNVRGNRNGGVKKTSGAKKAGNVNKSNSSSNKSIPVNANRKARAAVTNKRSATSGNAKRAGVSGNVRKARVVSARKTVNNRALRGKIKAEEEASLEETETLSSEVVNKMSEHDRKFKKLAELKGLANDCPVEKALGRKIDEDGDEFFYTGKEPFNGENFCDERLILSNQIADLYKWKESDKEKYPRGSLDDSDEIFYFKCKEGYVAKNNSDGIRTCVSVCPLNVALEKSASYEDKYISPTNGLICSVPANSKARLVKDGENTRSDLDDENAYIVECNANKYSAVLDGSDSEVHYQCLTCPSGYVSSAGAKSVAECKEECKGDKIKLDDGSCVACDANASVSGNSCICKDGYYGKGYGTDGCVTCPSGYVCSGGEKKSKYVSEQAEETSSNEQQSCPEGSKPSSDGTTCVCDDSNYTFDSKSNSCVEKVCGSNEVKMSDGTCKAISSLVASEFNRVATGKSGNSNCPTGDLEAGVYLVTLKGGNGGNSGSSGKNKAGQTEKDVSGGKGAKLQYVFKLSKNATFEICAGENGKLPADTDSPNEGGGGGGGSWLNINSPEFSGDVYFVAGGGGGASADYAGQDGGGGGGGGGIGAGGAAGEGKGYSYGGYGGMSGKYPGGVYKQYNDNNKSGVTKLYGYIPDIAKGLNDSNPLLMGDSGRSGGGAGGGNGGDGGDGQEWFGNANCAKGAVANIDTINIIDFDGKVTKQSQQYGGKGGVACQASHHRAGYDGESSHISNINLSNLCGGSNKADACAELYKLK